MNVTISLDETLVQRARERAQSMGKTLNQLIREYLEEMTGTQDRGGLVEELRRLRQRGGGNSGGWKFQREEFYFLNS